MKKFSPAVQEFFAGAGGMMPYSDLKYKNKHDIVYFRSDTTVPYVVTKAWDKEFNLVNIRGATNGNSSERMIDMSELICERP